MAFPALAKAAPILNRKRGWWIPLPLAADVLGGCLFRRDEVVISDSEVISALRPVLRYRTTLSRGAPDETLTAYWDAAKLLFPGWVGFRPSRLRWTRRSAAAYRRMEVETRKIIRLGLGGDHE